MHYLFIYLKFIYLFKKQQSIAKEFNIETYRKGD